MSKFTLAGLVSWLGGLLLLGFQSISTLMNVDGHWQSICLTDIIEEKYLVWTDGVTWNLALQSINYVLSMPLFILLFCIGTLLFIINAFFE